MPRRRAPIAKALARASVLPPEAEVTDRHELAIDEPRGLADVLKSAADLTASLRGLPAGEQLYSPSNRPTSLAKSGGDAVAKVQGLAGGVLQADTTEHSNVLPSNDDVHTIFTMAGALFPPYDPEALVTLLEHSTALRPNLEAYATNIDSFGHRFEEVVKLDSSEADQKIGDAIFLSRLNDQEAQSPGAASVVAYPTPEEIAAKKVEVGSLQRLEHARLTKFFDHCVAEESFTELRRRSRIDYESTGNAYWEVLRNAKGEIAQFVYVPAYSIRLMPIEHRHHQYTAKQRISLLEYESVTMRRRFRRFVQVVLDRVVHFKEFGDARVLSRKTGREYPSVDDLLAEDAADGPATELMHFKVHSPRSPYGIPRWIGALLPVLGSRAADEVNFLYFDNKAVPPMAILVSGGTLATASKDKLASYIRDNIRGKENFHRILIIEAEAAAAPGLTTTGRVRIELKPLMDAQQQDAQFQNYDERNIDKVGMAFRVPRLLRGDVRDFNRATADAALKFTEMQTFQPERDRFDDIINRHILTTMGIRFWQFQSQSPVNRDPAEVTTMATAFGNAGAITPNEMREAASEALNHDFKKIREPWGDQPFPLTLAGVMPPEDVAAGLGLPAPGAPGAPTPVDPANPAAPAKAAGPLSPHDRRLRAVAASLMALQQGLGKAADRAHARDLDTWKRDGAGRADGVIEICLSKAEIDSFFERGPT